MDRSKMDQTSNTAPETLETSHDTLSPIQEFLQDQNNCCLCGSELKFTHKFDHLELTVLEDAKCEDCRISLRTRSYGLQ